MNPTPGWTTTATVDRVLDGDTIEVTITRHLTVRLLDCWAPETRTTDENEKQRGLAAKQHLETLLHRGEVILQVPSQGDGDVSELFTFGRVLGRVYNRTTPRGRWRDVSTQMVAAGHATVTKR